jgi:multidrug efflux pump subunit AcrA (membrane-fusion protein)
VETRTVKLGENDGTRVVVTDGLAEGDLVVVPGK